MSRRILVVEDDDDTRDYLAKALRETGYTVEATASGREGLMHALGGGFDALVLDRMLPDLDGLVAAEVGARRRRPDPRDHADRHERHRRAGARPARRRRRLRGQALLLRRALRPARGGAAPPGRDPAEETRLACGDLELDLIARTARRGDRRIELLPREFQMLEYLMRRQGRVVTRTMLLEGVWDYRFDPRTNVIDVHISRLRRKIDAEGEPPLIHTVRGSGYKLAAGA